MVTGKKFLYLWSDDLNGTGLKGQIPFNARTVHSSNVEWVGWPYRRPERMMVVEFKDGSRYAYLGVSRQRAVACAMAFSSGIYLNARVKPNFKVVKLR
jgi:hypothetical protein